MPGELVKISVLDSVTRHLVAIDEPTLQQLQEAVGGQIQIVHVEYRGNLRRMYVNSDGLRRNLAPNRLASRIAGRTDRSILAPACIWEPR